MSEQVSMFGFAGVKAVLSEDRRYRYLLRRVWDEALSLVLFVMLNPSTADAEQDDPTIRRCLDFARRWGFGSLEVVNLFAFRATDPLELLPWRCADPVGPENQRHVDEAAIRAARIVCAWGDYRKLKIQSPIAATLSRYPRFSLGVTKHGLPRHPLYVKGDTKLEQFGAELTQPKGRI